MEAEGVVVRDWILEQLAVGLAEQFWEILFWFADEIVSPLEYFRSGFHLGVLSQCLKHDLNFIHV